MPDSSGFQQTARQPPVNRYIRVQYHLSGLPRLLKGLYFLGYTEGTWEAI